MLQYGKIYKLSIMETMFSDPSLYSPPPVVVKIVKIIVNNTKKY